MSGARLCAAGPAAGLPSAAMNAKRALLGAVVAAIVGAVAGLVTRREWGDDYSEAGAEP